MRDLKKVRQLDNLWSLLFTQIFVHENNDGIRKCSFMVPEYIFFIWLFKKKLIDLSVQVLFIFVCLFVYIC